MNTINVRIPRDLAETYRDLARLTDCSLNTACVEGLRRGIAYEALTGTTRAEVDVILAVRHAVGEGVARAGKPSDRGGPTAYAKSFLPRQPSLAVEPPSALTTKLRDCDFSVRTSNSLETFCKMRGLPYDTTTLAEFAVVASAADLLRTRNFWRKALGEVEVALAAVGLRLREPKP